MVYVYYELHQDNRRSTKRTMSEKSRGCYYKHTMSQLPALPQKVDGGPVAMILLKTSALYQHLNNPEREQPCLSFGEYCWTTASASAPPSPRQWYELQGMQENSQQLLPGAAGWYLRWQVVDAENSLWRLSRAGRSSVEPEDRRREWAAINF